MSQKKKDPDFVLPTADINYEPNRPSALQSLSACSCRICAIASVNGLNSKKLTKKRGRPSSTATSKPAEKYKVCSRCFARIYRGSNHSSASCLNSRREKLDNIVELVNSPKSMERIAARTINKSTDGTLATLGKRKNINLAPESKRILFQPTDIIGISKDLQLSNKETKTLARDIRIATGSRKSVEPNAREEINKINHQLDEFFEVRNLAYRRENKESKVSEIVYHPTIVCKDVSTLVDEIIQKSKKIDSDSLLLKISIDRGGGFLKICLSLFDIDKPSQVKVTL